MHRLLRKYLPDAIGVSEFVIALNIDIRGFSAFSTQIESPEVAAYIKRVYVELIDNYFPGVSFFKPTGDGLLLIITYDEATLQQRIRDVVSACFKILKHFGSFTAKDPMINFEVPQRIGMGLSRGTACRLVSKGRTLDFSGRVLNLASRLMDFARPSGIVFDSDFGIQLLTQEQVAAFASDHVFVKGIAEGEPIDIFYSKEFTTISPLSKQPIEQARWAKQHYDTTLKRIKVSKSFTIPLSSKATDPSQIKLKITHPAVFKGRKQSALNTVFEFTDFQYELDADEPSISIRYDALAQRLINQGVKDSWPIELDIRYPEL